MAATRVLTQQAVLRQQAADAATQVQAHEQRRYAAGQVSCTEVVTAQASALAARRALVPLLANRQTTAAALIPPLGGGWQVPD